MKDGQQSASGSRLTSTNRSWTHAFRIECHQLLSDTPVRGKCPQSATLEASAPWSKMPSLHRWVGRHGESSGAKSPIKACGVVWLNFYLRAEALANHIHEEATFGQHLQSFREVYHNIRRFFLHQIIFPLFSRKHVFVISAVIRQRLHYCVHILSHHSLPYIAILSRKKEKCATFCWNV